MLFSPAFTTVLQDAQAAMEWLDAQDLGEYNIVHIQGLLGTDAQQTAPALWTRRQPPKEEILSEDLR